MSKIWSFMIAISIAIAFICGNVSEVPNIIMESSVNATENIVKLIGMTCFWSGMFNILQKTSLIEKLSKLITMSIKGLFNKEEVNDKAMENISLNMTCDMLGVGNAATVYGLKAIEELNKENKEKERANDSIIMFVILNAASIQLIPTGMITLRAMYNSQNPVEIVPWVWLVTVAALIVGIVSCKILNKFIK